MSEFTPTGSLNPVRLGSDATKITLKFIDRENTPELLMRQVEDSKITREVQTKMDYMTPYTTGADLGGATIKWSKITHKRELRRLSLNISTFEPTAQKFQKWGMTASKYGDEHYITDWVEAKSTVNIPKVVMVEMQSAIVRLRIRQAFASMLNPVRWQYQHRFNEFKTDTGLIGLPDSRTGAICVIVKHSTNTGLNFATGAHTALQKTEAGKYAVYPVGNVTIDGQDGTVWLARPSLRIFTKLKRAFTNLNVDASMIPCMTVTPNMQEYLEEIPEYDNRFNIWQGKTENSRMQAFPWKDIKFLRATPECAPGAYFAGKNIDATNARIDAVASGTTKAEDGPQPQLLPLTEKASGGAVTSASLRASGHEALPLWFKENVYIVGDRARDKSKVTALPHLRGTRVLWVEKWIGGAKAQNELAYVVAVPYQE